MTIKKLAEEWEDFQRQDRLDLLDAESLDSHKYSYYSGAWMMYLKLKEIAGELPEDDMQEVVDQKLDEVTEYFGERLLQKKKETISIAAKLASRATHH